MPAQIIDGVGTSHILYSKPLRIISIVPSLTEYLFHIGLNHQIVGRTKFCIHPAEHIKEVPKIGGTKNLNIAKIKSLKADLIIANKEENVKEQIDELKKFTSVYTASISNIVDAIHELKQIALLTGRKSQAAQLIFQIQSKLNSSPAENLKKINCAYLIWQKPYMTVGSDTFIHDMMERFGFLNVFADHRRYPEVSTKELANSNADVIMLSSEPFPFKQKHIYEMQEKLPDKKLIIVDGEMFSWYGNRMLSGMDYAHNLYCDLIGKNVF